MALDALRGLFHEVPVNGRNDRDAKPKFMMDRKHMENAVHREEQRLPEPNKMKLGPYCCKKLL
jgi:hypothetical protein